MANSQEDKNRNHERIVEIAARRFREVGLEGASIADVMKEAGLTHGGFYKHFDSRDDLVLEAMATALRSGTSGKGSAAPKGPLTFESVIEAYLNKRHRDDAGSGCAMAALLSDVGRANEETKAVFTSQVQRNIEGLQRVLAADSRPDDKQSAIVVLCLMAGALGIARAVADEKLSLEILASAREFILSRSNG
ncbi:TetR/AcrR family transcriptional regulator [Paraburkholderia silviterrae]|uniref:TetR/AcrR family transcriptional regulator n=1 Tax=Paraburkholderia silviterrae TaxID=2528715 RepID=A0A4R5M154_9BURK|nr:TetR/AcrR family transcriptional regulator [Paraburkholderia silviterrae]TDG18860.1 TetR/AcrR family transcriptional regulator [Paraburkholderia silviterrae]